MDFNMDSLNVASSFLNFDNKSGLCFAGPSCEYAGTISNESTLETEHIVFIATREGSYYCYFTQSGHLTTLQPTLTGNNNTGNTRTPSVGIATANDSDGVVISNDGDESALSLYER